MKNSLGALLALGFAGLQFLTVLLVVFSSYLTSERALIGHARDLLHDVGTNTIEHSKGFLSPAHGAAVLAARLAQNDVVASDDPEQLEKLLFQQLQLVPQFSGIFFGTDDGEFVYVMRSHPVGRFRSKIITYAGGKRTTELIWRNDKFEILDRKFDPTDTYDPRERPWFKSARETNGTIWTDPYIFFTSQQPGLTLASPVESGGQGRKGVMGVDIEISSISDFLSRLKVGHTGKALIINKNGDVIAHPDQGLIKIENDDGSLRFVTIGEIDDPIARTAFSPLFKRDGEAPVVPETTSQFVFDGATYVSVVMPVVSDILPWTIAVYAPQDDFTEVIKHNRATNIWIAALVAVVTGAIGLILANYIHRPVRAFAVRSALISQGELDPSEPPPNTYKELENANDALVQEIVARKKAEREYGQTFELSSRAMAQVASDTGQIIRVNERFCDITGYQPDEITRMQFSDLADPADPRFPSSTEFLADNDLPLNSEMRCICKDGTAIWVKVNAITIRNQNGKPLHAVVTMDDVTRAKAKEQQILQLNRDLSHLARGKTMGQMASGLAHELNQPLAAIAQNVDAALLTVGQGPETDPELREILVEIEEQSIRAGDIIRALRGFIAKDEGNRTTFDFGELLEQTRRLVQADANEAGAVIQTRLSDLPRVEGNRVQIAQVILNLLRNSIEAMAGQPEGQKKVLVFSHLKDGQVCICVEDTGPGIDPSIKLFSEFETTKPDGMGLGLSICRSIIEANGGELWHDESCKSGARFCFTLPPHTDTPAAGSPAPGTT